MSTDREHPAAIDPDDLLKTCDTRRSRASGPGGQHRNKVETAIELVHQPTGVIGAASERRSQADNHRNALFRLRVNLALDVRTHYEPGAEPSELWRSRCRGGRVSINPTHRDFPALLAEALDVLAAVRYDPKRAAAVLACTTSQLIKLLKLEPRALQQINDQRTVRGQHTLK